MLSKHQNTSAEAEEQLCRKSSFAGSSSAVQQEVIMVEIENNNQNAEVQEQSAGSSTILNNKTELFRCKIYEAAAKGDIESLSSYDPTEIESFETRREKNTILHIYIIAQSSKLREKILRDKPPRTFGEAFRNIRQKFFMATATPLTAFETETDTVVSILVRWPSLLWKANKAGDSPLHMAARHGILSIAETLITRVAENDVEKGGVNGVLAMLHSNNADKETALHEAVRYQHESVVKLLIGKDAKEFVYSENKYGETPLYMAAERGNENLVEMILEGYTSPAYEGPDGRTALHAAAIHCCSSGACEAIVAICGEKLTTEKDSRGWTPLHYKPYILSFGICTSAAFVADNKGKTALHIAAGKGCTYSVEEFIKRCPECFELVDNKGRNALHYAVKSGNKKVADAILKSEYLGDLVKKKDNKGITPLHLMATHCIYMPKLIKDPRFDKMAFNNEQQTPLDIILKNLNSSTPSEKNLVNDMLKAGMYQGNRIVPQCSNNIENDTEEEIKEARQNHFVAVTFIATITFAAGFTLPGGYIQEDGPHLGYAVFTRKTAFQAFVIIDTLAMVLSCAAVFIHLLIAMEKVKIISLNALKEEMIDMDKGSEIMSTVYAMIQRKMMVSKLFNKALTLTLIAIVAMVFAFITGTYAVLSIYPPLAIATTVTGCLFFVLFWYLWEELIIVSKALFYAVIGVVSIILYCIQWRLYPWAKKALALGPSQIKGPKI